MLSVDTFDRASVAARLTLRAALAVALTVSVAFAGMAAEKPSTGVPLPGLESDPPGSVAPRSAAVTLRDGHVTLDLLASATGEATALMLNGSLFGWLGAAERYPDRQFPELKIRLNGVEIAPQDRFEAMVGRNDVTHLLREADLDPWVITRNPPVTTVHPRHRQVLQLLRNVGAIADPGSGAGAGGLFTAKWVARRVLTIPLAPAADATLRLDYESRPGVPLLTDDGVVANSWERLYCLAAQNLRKLKADFTKIPVSTVTVREYEIATGIDGKAPASVTLSLTAHATDGRMRPSMAYWCGPSGKSMVRRGVVDRERASVDVSGRLHVLTILD